MEKWLDPGCGCVWCDLDVARIKLKRQYVHRRKFNTFVCTRIDHMSYPDKPGSDRTPSVKPNGEAPAF